MAELRIHAGLAMAAGAIFMPVCTACVGLRLYARRLHGLSPGADDWTSVAALVSSHGVRKFERGNSILCIGFCCGHGHHHHHR